MTTRYVYIPKTPAASSKPGVLEVSVEFDWFGGFSIQQKQRCIEALHRTFLQRHPQHRILEASRYSQSAFGQRLSAFNLCDSQGVNVEANYQASKVFEGSHMTGPFFDLFESICEAKLRYEGLTAVTKELREKVKIFGEGRRLVHFKFHNEEWPLEPTRLFYDWLYCQALSANREISKQLQSYNAFTDIAFNPKQSVNCQAYALALYRSFQEFGVTKKALESRDSFVMVHPSEHVALPDGGYGKKSVKSINDSFLPGFAPT